MDFAISCFVPTDLLDREIFCQKFQKMSLTKLGSLQWQFDILFNPSSIQQANPGSNIGVLGLTSKPRFKACSFCLCVQRISLAQFGIGCLCKIEQMPFFAQNHHI